jgi:hypothetical protein
VAGGFYLGLPEDDGSTANRNKLQDNSRCSLKKKTSFGVLRSYQL